MSPTFLHEFDSLSSSYTPQLVAGLAICGAVLVVSGHRLAIVAFLVQRLIVVALLWPSVRLPLAAVMLLASIAAVLVYIVTEGRLLIKARHVRHTSQRRSFLAQVPFRALAAALGLLVTYGLVQGYGSNLLPLAVASTVVSLLVSSLLVVILANTGLQTGLGVQTFIDACRVLYALWQPNSLVWGLWAVCDVLVALAACHLRNTEVAVVERQTAGECG